MPMSIFLRVGGMFNKMHETTRDPQMSWFWKWMNMENWGVNIKKHSTELYKEWGKAKPGSETCDNVKNNNQGIFTSIWRKKNQKDIGSLTGAEGGRLGTEMTQRAELLSSSACLLCQGEYSSDWKRHNHMREMKP